LLVTDQMSLRDVLARTGQESALRLAREMHLSLEHAGAQIVELSGALIGMALVAFSIRGLLRTAR
jgi:hypothetical protein